MNGNKRKINTTNINEDELDEEINNEDDDDLDESKQDEIDGLEDELNEESELGAGADEELYNGYAADEVNFNEDDENGDNTEAYTEYDEDNYEPADENNNYLDDQSELNEINGDEYDEENAELNENQDDEDYENAYYVNLALNKAKASDLKANNLQQNKHILNSNSSSSLVSISNLKTSHSLFGANNKVVTNRATNGVGLNKNRQVNSQANSQQLFQSGGKNRNAAQKAKQMLNYDENSNNSTNNVEVVSSFANKLSQSRNASSNNAGLAMSSSGTKHSCNICKKTFKTQNILRQHMRIHTGDKPFSCDICNKSFSQMASLKYHLATHSDDRPFRCENCSKTFKLKPPYKKHIKECQPRHPSQKHQPSSSSSNASSSSVYYSNQLNNNTSGLNVDMNDDDE